MRLTIVERKKQQDQREMIALSCKTSLSRINPNTANTMYLIESLCRTYNLQYSPLFGSICAHVSLHYPPLHQQKQDRIVADYIINRFPLIFLSQKYLHTVKSHPNFECFDDLGSYGMKSMAYALRQEMVEVLNKKQVYKDRLRSISNRLLRSLMLEYVPKEYSAGLLKVYLQHFFQKEKEQMSESGNSMHKELSPYDDIFLIMQALSKHIVEVRKPVNIEHYLEMMEKPMMGVVEWPMVIGSRDMNDLPPIFDDYE